MMRFLAILAAMVMLAACQTSVPEGAGPDGCGAGALQGLVGQSATVLQRMKFAGPTRILRPGMAVTMDYSPDRLNIEIDGAGRIIRVQCG
jgi:hypothetical protein